MKRCAAAAMLVLVTALVVGCGSGSVRSTGDTTISPNLSLDDVYARMERALDGGQGKIFHATIAGQFKYTYTEPTPEGAGAISELSYAYDVWFDASVGVARVEASMKSPANVDSGISRLIVRKDGTFAVDGKGNSKDVDSLICRGSDSAVIAQLTGCRNYLEKSTTNVESGTYRGHPVIMLVTTGTLPSEDASPPFEERLYLDPVSYLPIGAETSSTHSPGAPVDSYGSRQYSNEFLDRSTLAADFFEPAGIDYVEKDPAANLKSEVDSMQVYWLGSEFDPGTGAAPLVLFRASARGSQTPPGYRATASYELKGGRRNYPVINLQEYPTAAWSHLNPDSGGHTWNEPGVTREDLSIPGGRAVLFRVRASYERYIAHVYFDTAVILVGDADQPSPYANRDAMLAIIKGLRPFE